MYVLSAFLRGFSWLAGFHPAFLILSLEAAWLLWKNHELEGTGMGGNQFILCSKALFIYRKIQNAQLSLIQLCMCEIDGGVLEVCLFGGSLCWLCTHHHTSGPLNQRSIIQDMAKGRSAPWRVGISVHYSILQPSCSSSVFLFQGNALYFKSARNVTVNILNDQTKVLTQLVTGKRRTNRWMAGPSVPRQSRLYCPVKYCMNLNKDVPAIYSVQKENSACTLWVCQKILSYLFTCLTYQMPWHLLLWKSCL